MKRINLILVYLFASGSQLFSQEEIKPLEFGYSFTIQSVELKRDIRIFVYLPKDYYHEDTIYPVLYHAYCSRELFVKAAAETWYLSEMAKNLPGKGQQIPKLIVIGIDTKDLDFGLHFMPRIETEHIDDTGLAVFKHFLTHELIPRIDSTFRTSGFRIIYGQAHSEFFLKYLLLTDPGNFNAFIHNGSGFLPNLEDYYFELARRVETKNLLSEKSIFISSGLMDPFYEKYEKMQIPAFIEQINNPGIRIKYKIYTDEGHVPQSTLWDALIWIFKE